MKVSNKIICNYQISVKERNSPGRTEVDPIQDYLKNDDRSTGLSLPHHIGLFPDQQNNLTPFLRRRNRRSFS